MHRNGYKGRKFGRENDQRRALLRGLMIALIEHHSINTTVAKAKEIRRPMEKLITLAKKGGLANRRLVIARLDSVTMGNYLVDAVAPNIKRNSGYLRITRTGFRAGDNAEMATISFVDEIKPIAKPAASSSSRAKSKTNTEAKEKTAKLPLKDKETK
ncbi:50S ribosomal protein L17 [Candidatus Saccharibacteria bacterium]|nr:50S ribosomal protein L17 [Candidatus Saccharibacteria bacterium]